jgi:hypothetical protein
MTVFAYIPDIQFNLLNFRVGSPADPHPAPERPLTVLFLDLSNFAVRPDWDR